MLATARPSCHFVVHFFTDKQNDDDLMANNAALDAAINNPGIWLRYVNDLTGAVISRRCHGGV